MMTLECIVRDCSLRPSREEVPLGVETNGGEGDDLRSSEAAAMAEKPDSDRREVRGMRRKFDENSLIVVNWWEQ